MVVVVFGLMGVKFKVSINGFFNWWMWFIVVLLLICFEGVFKGVWISFFNFGILVMELLVEVVLEYLLRVLFFDKCFMELLFKSVL